LKKWDKPSAGLALGDSTDKSFKGKCFVGVEADTFSLVEMGLQTLSLIREKFPVVQKL